MSYDTQKKLLLDLGITKNADISLRRKRKKDPILEKLEKAFPDTRWQDLEKIYFHSSVEKKQSLHDISAQMLAVNSNKSLDHMLLPKGKKAKINEEQTNKSKKAQTISFDNLDYLKDVLINNNITSKENNETTEELEKNKFEPDKDGELLSLLDSFMSN